MSQYLSEAFRKLDLLNEDTFSISDSGLKDFIEFNDADEIDDEITVIDPEAETLEDVQDSYVGKIILDCCVCHSKLYKDIEDVVIEDDIANANEECPFCYTTDGYKVIGKVAAFDEEEGEEPEEVEDTDVEEKEEIEVDDKDDEIEEGLFNKGSKSQELTRAIHITSGVDSRDEAVSILQDIQTNCGMKSESETTDILIHGKKKAFALCVPSSDIAKVTKYADKKYPNVKFEVEDDFDIARLQEESESINEDINNLSLDTDDTHMEMTSDESGKVTITTEPVDNAKTDENETIAPIEPEVQNEIESNVANGEEIEIDVDEFDEESFDALGEGYLKKVYENVNSFKTSRVLFINNKLIVEGIINFTSGNSKKTNFIFESREATKKGKIRFIGENKEIARGKKAFTVTGTVKDKKFLSERFNYNYGVKSAGGKVKRLYGTIK